LLQNHNRSMVDIEMMLPWEREIYLDLLQEELKAQKEEQQRQQNAG